MTTIRSIRLTAASALLVALVSACTSSTPLPSATPSATVAPSTQPAIALKVYFLMGDRGAGYLIPVERSVPQTEDVTAAAIRELLAGPTAEERAGIYPGRRERLFLLSTAVPADTQLLGIEIEDGVATVDLSGDFGSGELDAFVYRQAQIVYTLTQFPTVDRVAFRLDGTPMAAIEGHEGSALIGPAARNSYFDQRRPVFVDDPAWGAPVGDVIRVSGETTEEAPIRFALVDGATDRILAEQTVRAACDPCMAPAPWGPFEARLSLPAGPRPADLRLRIWEPSFGDGSPTSVFDYPLG